MRKAELSEALKLAQDPNVDLSAEDDLFNGFGLPDFKPVTCTIRQLAKLVRWQCICLNGAVDGNNLNEIAEIGRKKFIVV